MRRIVTEKITLSLNPETEDGYALKHDGSGTPDHLERQIWLDGDLLGTWTRIEKKDDPGLVYVGVSGGPDSYIHGLRDTSITIDYEPSDA